MAEQLDPAPSSTSEERFPGVFEPVWDHAWSAAVDDQGTMQVEWLTESMARDFDVDPDQPGELGVLVDVHPDDGAEVERGLGLLRGGQEFLAEIRMPLAEGGTAWTLLYARPVMDPDGRLVRVVGAVRSIDDRRELEAKLLQSIEQLRRTDVERRGLLDRLEQTVASETDTVEEDPEADPIEAMAAASRRLDHLSGRLAEWLHADALRQVDEAITRGIDRLRRLMFELQPPDLGGEGIAAALWAYMEGARAETGVTYRLENRLLEEPDEQVRLLLYRIVQEALSNVRRHARADHVEVLVQDLEDGIFIRVWDDGLGFTASEVLPQHGGLVAMRERAETLGGWCRIQSLPGMGTKVEVWLPAEGADPNKEPDLDSFASWGLSS